MKNQEILSESKIWKVWLVLFLRWFFGGIIGCISSLFLLILAETVYPPIIGPIIAGQQEILYFILDLLLPDNFVSLDFVYELSVIIYLIFWALVGALIASGNKIQKRIGALFLVIYILSGIGFTIFSIFMFMST